MSEFDSFAVTSELNRKVSENCVPVTPAGYSHVNDSVECRWNSPEIIK